jgi:hypothetical protein
VCIFFSKICTLRYCLYTNTSEIRTREISISSIVIVHSGYIFHRSLFFLLSFFLSHLLFYVYKQPSSYFELFYTDVFCIYFYRGSDLRNILNKKDSVDVINTHSNAKNILFENSCPFSSHMKMLMMYISMINYHFE